MKLLAASALAIGLGFAAISASQAMPIAPLDQSQAAPEDTIRVAGGCGPGWHRGPYGGCRPMDNYPPGVHSGLWAVVGLEIGRIGARQGRRRARSAKVETVFASDRALSGQ